MALKAADIVKKYPDNLKRLSGPVEAEATAPCSAEQPQAQALVFAPNLKQLETCLKEKVAIAVIPEKLQHQAPEAPDQAILVAKNLDLAMAQINEHFFPINYFNSQGFENEKIHPTAVIAKSAELGKEVIVGPNAIIGEQTIIGDRTIIAANAVIESGVKIGSKNQIHPLATIARNCILGDNCIVQSQTVVGSIGYGYAFDSKAQAHHKPHYGKVVIGNNVEIGAGTCIDRGAFSDTTIGDGTKIDNNCHIGHNNIIGKNCMITASFSSAGSAKVGDNCHFAGGFRLGGHIEICDNCTFLGVTTVAKSITEPGIYGGWPPEKHKDFLRRQSALPHLAELRKDVKKIKQKLDLE